MAHGSLREEVIAKAIMREKRRNGVFFLPALAALWLLLPHVLMAAGPQPKLARVVFVTTSKACGCTLERCQAADAVVSLVFVGARQGLIKRLDYAKDKDQARVYIKKYHLVMIPALLFLDDQENLLWSALGEFSKDSLVEKLGQYGG